MSLHQRARASGPRMPAGPLCCAALAAALGSSSCASVAFTRDSETSGRFESTGLAVTLFSIDLPSRAIDIARENASDARQPNLVIDESWVFPYLGPVDFLLDIIGVRYAHVSGSWGFDPDDPRAATAR